MSTEVAVIGAGPAGLMAAWRAAAAGHEVTVVERASVPGGMAGSFDVAGVRVDHGSHRLHPSCPAPVLAGLRGLLGDDLQVRPRNGRIRLAGRWVAFPLRAGDLVRSLPRRVAVGAAFDAVTSPLRRAWADTFSEVVRAGLGPTIAGMFYEPYARKLWGIDPSELDGELARRRVSASSPVAVARRLAHGARPVGRTFLYPRRGFGQISDALADAATAAGGAVRFDVGVTGVDLGQRGSVALALSDGSRLTAAHVWSTAPLPLLAGMADPVPPPSVLAAAARLEHRVMVLVYLVLDSPRYTPYDADYFPAVELRTSRLSEPRNYRDSADDPPDRTVLCAEVPVTVGDDVWSAADDGLASLVADDLAAAGLERPAVADVHVRRLPHVYPLYRRGFQEDLSALDRWAYRNPELLTFGRQGRFVPDNTHHVLAMGEAAASALRADGSFDRASWKRSCDEFRSFVVED